MQKYKITILTPSGQETLIFDPNKQSLESLETELKTKHGTFITLKSEPIN